MKKLIFLSVLWMLYILPTYAAQSTDTTSKAPLKWGPLISGKFPVPFWESSYTEQKAFQGDLFIEYQPHSIIGLRSGIGYGHQYTTFKSVEPPRTITLRFVEVPVLISLCPSPLLEKSIFTGIALRYFTNNDLTLENQQAKEKLPDQAGALTKHDWQFVFGTQSAVGAGFLLGSRIGLSLSGIEKHWYRELRSQFCLGYDFAQLISGAAHRPPEQPAADLADFRVGIIGGLCTGFVGYPPADYDVSTYRLGFYGGMVVEYRLAQMIALRSGLSYVRQGATLSQLDSADGHATLGLNYLQVPILLGLRTSPNTGFFLGVQLGHLLEATWQASVSQKDYDKGAFEAFNCSFVWATEYELDMGLLIGNYSTIGLTKIMKQRAATAKEEPKNSTTQFYLGYNLLKLF
ncbi:MAG: porin family protein [Roseivirga sp.]